MIELSELPEAMHEVPELILAIGAYNLMPTAVEAIDYLELVMQSIITGFSTGKPETTEERAVICQTLETLLRREYRLWLGFAVRMPDGWRVAYHG